jgi:hypothetical protein
MRVASDQSRPIEMGRLIIDYAVVPPRQAIAQPMQAHFLFAPSGLGS